MKLKPMVHALIMVYGWKPRHHTAALGTLKTVAFKDNRVYASLRWENLLQSPGGKGDYYFGGAHADIAA